MCLHIVYKIMSLCLYARVNASFPVHGPSIIELLVDTLLDEISGSHGVEYEDDCLL
jgi:hypothetical protein